MAKGAADRVPAVVTGTGRRRQLSEEDKRRIVEETCRLGQSLSAVDIRANLLSARFSKRAPAAIRILSSACCRDHHDTGATELTDKICRVRRPVGIPAT